MSCPSRRCSPGCGCHDFSSRAAQLPSLVSIEVVGDLLFQAVRNTVRRAVSAAAGDMSPQEIDEADNRLVDWLGTTFSGGNPHYASGEDWNPRGLAVFLRDMISDELRETAGAAVFLADLYRILNDLSRAGVNMDGVENSPQAARLINFWARLLTGAPAEVLLH